MRQIKSSTLNRGFNAYLFGKKDHLSRDQKKQKDQAISNLRSTYGDDFESHIVPKALKSSYKPIITPLKLELTLNQSLEDLADAYAQIEQLESKLRHTKDKQKDQTALEKANRDLIERCRVLQEGIDQYQTENDAIVKRLQTIPALEEEIFNLRARDVLAQEAQLAHAKIEEDLKAKIKSLQGTANANKQWSEKYKAAYEKTEHKYNELVIKYNELFEAASLMKSTLDGKNTAVEGNQGKICQLEATITKLREVPKAMHAEFAHRIALLEKERDERLTPAQSAKLMAELSEMNQTSRSDKEIIKTLNNQILELQSRLIEQQKNLLAQKETSNPEGKNTDQQKTIQQSVRSWLKHFFE